MDDATKRFLSSSCKDSGTQALSQQMQNKVWILSLSHGKITGKAENTKTSSRVLTTLVPFQLSLFIGNMTVKIAPIPKLCISILPPCALIAERHKLSPTPRPSDLLRPILNGLNKSYNSCLEMPFPSSLTIKIAELILRVTLISISPLSLNLIALLTKLSTICLI